jgi:hypothetical protein
MTIIILPLMGLCPYLGGGIILLLPHLCRTKLGSIGIRVQRDATVAEPVEASCVVAPRWLTFSFSAA